MFVYVIVCDESLKIYIGQHKGVDLQKYLHQKISHALHHESKGSALYNAMRAHPSESWSIWPLVSGIESREELNELERHYIRVLKARCKDVGYNICRGGEGFTGAHTKKSKSKISKTLTGHLVLPETRKKIGDGNRGKSRSEDFRARCSKRGKARAGHFSTEQIRAMSQGTAKSWKNPVIRERRMRALRAQGPRGSKIRDFAAREGVSYLSAWRRLVSNGQHKVTPRN